MSSMAAPDFARMQSIMQAFRGGIKEFGGKKVVRLLDYVQGLDGLPKGVRVLFLYTVLYVIRIHITIRKFFCIA